MTPQSSKNHEFRNIADLAAKLQTDSIHPDPVQLSAALTAENLSFFTFALILVLERHGTLSIAQLAQTVGHSYWAVRSQIVNTPYFLFTKPAPLVGAILTDDAHIKLSKIKKRLTQESHVEAD